jgi:hypothetical protein
MAGAISGGHRADRSIPRDGRPDLRCKIHRALPGIQVRTLRGILLDRHPSEYSMAILGGVLLAKLIFGQVRVPG